MRHHRKSIRLRHHDYTSAGAYFITICVNRRIPLFGVVDEQGMQLSNMGKIVDQRWREISSRFRHATLDDFVIMPDHLHGIVILNEPIFVQPSFREPECSRKFQHVPPHSLSTIVQSFKANVSRDCKSGDNAEFQWQRNYYERIIRNADELKHARSYIQNNPARWWAKQMSSNV